MLDSFFSVVFVLALLGAALWWLRRNGAARLGAGRTRMLDVVESRPLGRGQALHLVRAGERALVLVSHASGCTLLESRDWNDLAK